MFLTSIHNVMTWRHRANAKTIFFLTQQLKVSKQAEKYLSSTSTSCHALGTACFMGFHDVLSSCKHKDNDIVEFSDPNNFRNRNVSTHLQAEMEEIGFVTSYSYI